MPHPTHRIRAVAARGRAAVHRITDPAVRAIADSRFVALTIWRPGLFGTPTSRYANLYRIVLPMFDLIALGTGMRAIRYGVPAFSDVTGGERFGDQWGTVVALASFACLIGITFPKLFLAELYGKVALFSALVVYSGTMLSLSLTAHGDSRSVISNIAFLAVLVPAWRLGDIATERRIRKNLRAASKIKAAQ